MKPILIILSLMFSLSCSDKSKYETMEQYVSKNNNHDSNLIRIGTTSYYPLINIISANGGIITSAESDFSKVSLKTEIKKNISISEMIDDFTNFRSDIIIISFSDYMKHFDSLKYTNPRAFAASARSAGSLAIEGNRNFFKENNSVSIKSDDSNFFAEFYCKLSKVKIEKNPGEIISEIDLCERTHTKDIIASTSSFPYFEPYILISRKYFLSDRNAAIAKFLKTIYEIQNPKDEIFSSANYSIDPAKASLIEQASIADAKALFGESSLSPNFIKLFKIRGGDNKKNSEFIDSFEPFFILTSEIKPITVQYTEKSIPQSFDLTLKADDGKISSSEIIKIEFYASAASTMRNASIKIITSGFTDYAEESSAIRRVKEKITTFGYSPNKITETRNRSSKSDKQLTITFQSE